MRRAFCNGRMIDKEYASHQKPVRKEERMSKLLYRTIADERPQGKPNVYFSCHPDDREKYFEKCHKAQ